MALIALPENILYVIFDVSNAILYTILKRIKIKASSTTILRMVVLKDTANIISFLKYNISREVHDYIITLPYS